MSDRALGGRQVEIVVQSTIPPETVVENVEASFARNTPRFAKLPNLGKRTGPVAIVGGGPSLKHELGSLKRFPGPIISCGSVHDYLIEHDIPIAYHCACDPEPVNTRWLRTPSKAVTYLIASQCHPDLFKALEGYDVRLWHATVILAATAKPLCDFRGEPEIPGADFVVGRAWPIAAVMGHKDVHFFGFDCSFPADCESQHAYAYDWVREEPVYVTCEHTGERFATVPGWLAQLNTFNKMLAMSAGQFTVTIHGESLAASMCCKPRKADLCQPSPLPEL